MSYAPPPLRRGDLRPSARRLNAMEARARANRPIGCGAIASREGSVGTTLWVDARAAGLGTQTFWVRLTEVGTGTRAGLYGWQGIVGVPDTYDWVDEGGHGSILDDPAIEANGCGTLKVGTRCEVRRELITRQVRFQLESCSTSSTKPTSPPPAPTPTPPNPTEPTTPPPVSYLGLMVPYPYPYRNPDPRAGGGAGSGGGLVVGPPTPDVALPSGRFLPSAVPSRIPLRPRLRPKGDGTG